MASSRSISLDSLRYIAVLMVLGQHLSPPCPPEELGERVCAVVERIIKGGWAGVDFFFVLSGFLVSGLLFREFQRTGRISIGRFLIRRGFKIYPAFFLLLVVYGVFEWQLGVVSQPINFLWEATFLQNYMGQIWNNTWSLAVKEHFYFSIGILLTWLATRNKDLHPVIPLSLFIMVGCLGMRIATNWSGGNTLYATHLRMDSLMFGVLLSYLHAFHSADLGRFMQRYGGWVALASAVLLSHLFVFHLDSTYMQTLGFTVNMIAFGGVMLVCFYNEQWFPELRAFQWMAAIGVDSYSLYLWHMFSKRSVSFVRKSVFELPSFWFSRLASGS